MLVDSGKSLGPFFKLRYVFFFFFFFPLSKLGLACLGETLECQLHSSLWLNRGPTNRDASSFVLVRSSELWTDITQSECQTWSWSLCLASPDLNSIIVICSNLRYPVQTNSPRTVNTRTMSTLSDYSSNHATRRLRCAQLAGKVKSHSLVCG